MFKHAEPWVSLRIKCTDIINTLLMTSIPPIKTYFLNTFVLFNFNFHQGLFLFSRISLHISLPIYSKHWMRNLRNILLGGKNPIPLMMDLVELILWNWPSCWKQCPDSVQHKSNSLCHFSMEIAKEIYVFIWKHNITNATLSEKSDTGSITIPDYKAYYRLLMIKPV